MDIKEDWIKQAKVSKEKYAEMYKESIENNDSFWNQHGNRIDWIKKYSKIKKLFMKEDIKACIKRMYYPLHWDVILIFYKIKKLIFLGL